MKIAVSAEPEQEAVLGGAIGARGVARADRSAPPPRSDPLPRPKVTPSPRKTSGMQNAAAVSSSGPSMPMKIMSTIM